MKDEVFLTPTTSFIAAIVFTLMLGVVDWLSGYELQFFVFYFIPIAVVAWNCSPTITYFIAILSSITWFAADWFSGHPYTNIGYSIWNTIIRLMAFLILGYAILRIKALLVEERAISRDLKQALSEVKTLTGLLPICAWCRKVRNDNGYWLQIEEYLKTHSEAQVTHGICQACAAKCMKEAGFGLPAIEPKPLGDGKPAP